MYARFSVISVGPAMRPKIEQLADRLAAHLKGVKGFKSITFLMDEAGGDYGSFSVWETRDDAEAANAAIRSQVTTVFEGLLTPWIFEVYEPRE